MLSNKYQLSLPFFVDLGGDITAVTANQEQLWRMIHSLLKSKNGIPQYNITQSLYNALRLSYC